MTDVSFPPMWLPSVDSVNDPADAILAIAGAALDLRGLGDTYGRRFVSHGADVPVEPGGDQHPSQLTVCAPRLFLGRAGQEQYQFADGALGRYSFVTVQYDVEVSRAWPVRQGAASVAPKVLSDARADLWRDAWVVFAALRAAALGGVTPRPAADADGFIVGPMVPKGPAGRYASWVIETRVQVV